MMRTLDEIIYHICADNPDINTDDFREDVLYYLKQYKEILPDYVALKEYWAHEQENPPLTWSELKDMKGQPVWVELLYHHPEQKYEYYDIIKRFDDIEGYELIDLAKTGYLYKSLLDREWKAYQRGKK